MKIHIPTTQYGFIEAEVETPEEAKDLHDEVSFQFIKYCSLKGLDTKSYNALVDRYLTDGTMEADQFAELNQEQLSWVQTTKRAFARIKGRK